MTNLFKIYLDKFRKQLLKFLLGFDLFEYILLQEKLMTITANTITILSNRCNYQDDLIQSITDTIVSQQKSLADTQSAVMNIINTIKIQQSEITKLSDNQTLTKKIKFSN